MVPFNHFGLLARHYASPASVSAAAHFALFASLYPAALGGDSLTFIAAAAGATHPRRFGWAAFTLVLTYQVWIGVKTCAVMPWPDNPSITLTIVIRPSVLCIVWSLAQALFAVALSSLLLLHLVSGFFVTLIANHPITSAVWLVASARGWSV